MTLLATTALESTWGEGAPILFLGEWCRLYDRAPVWEARTHEVVTHHWYDRAKLQRDHDYLEALHDRLLEALTPSLNRQHAVDHETRYWQTLLDPWLLTWLAVLFDRWENLRLAMGRADSFNTISLRGRIPSTVARDYSDFHEQLVSDEWNHLLFLDMLEFAYPGRCAIESPMGVALQDPLAAISPAPERSRAMQWLDRLGSWWPRRARAVFFHSYFGPAALARLNLSLGQAPRLYLREFKEVRPLPRVRTRPLHVPFDAGNEFERFVGIRLGADLPASVHEDYSLLRERASSLRLRPDVILTANAHWGNRLFKTWAAEQVTRGARLVTLEHGGSIPPRFDAMWFEERISDCKTLWARPTRPRQIRLPPNKIVGRPRRHRGAGELCLAVGFESWRYTQRATAYPVSGQVLEHFDMTCRFAEALAPVVRAAFQVKPFGNQGWNTRQRFIDRLGVANVATDLDFYALIGRSRLVVCTYPNTTFSEAMSSGAPTVLLYDPKYFETDVAFDGLLAALRAGKILFHDAQAAAAHVSAIWGDTLAWWNEPATQAARAEFDAQALHVAPDWLAQWRNFIRGMMR